MDCKHIEELLPLYVGRDLEEGRARQVTAHLQSCAPCARSAEEYGEAQQLLRQFEPPPFSEAVYAGIRRRVLSEIERQPVTPTLPQLLARLFQPRLAWGVSTALLLAACAFVFYYAADRMDWRRGSQQVADSRRAADPIAESGRPDMRSQDGEAAAPPSSPEKGRPPQTSTGRAAGPSATVADARFAVGTRSLTRRKAVTAGHARPPAGPGTGPSEGIAQASSAGHNPVEPDTADATVRSAATSEKPLRMEMQTGDQNIRIIWFSHQSATEDSASGSSKDI